MSDSFCRQMAVIVVQSQVKDNVGDGGIKMENC